MLSADELLRNLIAWATADANVRRLLLVGSRARPMPPDDLADFDLQVYAVTSEPYSRDESWLSAIGPVWVCIPDHYTDGGVHVPTRLVIFEAGWKADFAFYPAGRLAAGVLAGLPHKVLLEKGPVENDQAASLPRAPALDEAAFRRVVEEFWFEAYHVAKYLERDELWLVRARDWATKQFLLTMIGWHEQIVHGRLPLDDDGRRSSMSRETWEALPATFPAAEREEVRHAAVATIELFRRLATEVAAKTRFTYPVELDERMSQWIASRR